jgi:hypothetical protein
MKLQWKAEQQSDTAGRSRQLLSGDGQTFSASYPRSSGILRSV